MIACYILFSVFFVTVFVCEREPFDMLWCLKLCRLLCLQHFYSFLIFFNLYFITGPFNIQALLNVRGNCPSVISISNPILKAIHLKTWFNFSHFTVKVNHTLTKCRINRFDLQNVIAFGQGFGPSMCLIGWDRSICLFPSWNINIYIISGVNVT